MSVMLAVVFLFQSLISSCISLYYRMGFCCEKPIFNTKMVCLLFSGVSSEMSSAFNLDFEVSGIHGYVMMDGVMPALTEITCSFWMKSTDITNYGTPVSYAVEGSDNAFLLIDYNGSEMQNHLEKTSI